MKKTLLILVIALTAITQANTQTVLPIKYLKYDKINLLSKSDTGLLKAFPDSINKLDRINETNKIVLSNMLKEMNESSRFTPVFSIGLNGFENFNNLSGEASVGAIYRLSKYKLIQNNKGDYIIDPLYCYGLTGVRTAKSSDSNNLVKTFLFPEIGKRDLVFGIIFSERSNITRHMNYTWLTELSLNRFNDVANKKSYQTQSLMVGFKFTKTSLTDITDRNNWLEFFPYYMLIYTDPKYADDLAKYLNLSMLPTTVHTLGCRTTFQTNNAQFFCNMKYVLNDSKGINNPDLIRFVYTIGTNINL